MISKGVAAVSKSCNLTIQDHHVSKLTIEFDVVNVDLSRDKFLEGVFELMKELAIVELDKSEE